MRAAATHLRSGLALVVVFTLAASAQAQWTVAERVQLGGGIAVERMCIPRALTRRPSCRGWTPVGFAFGDALRWLTFARTFARVPATGRLVAVPGASTDPGYTGETPWMLLSDDGGAHWTATEDSGSARPTLLAFDNLTIDGVAAGDSGHIWSTSDGAVHWTDHGGDARVWSDLAIAGGEIVLADSSGNTFVSHDGGFARERLPVEGRAILEQRDDEIIVRTERTECTVRHGHGVHCVARSTPR